MLGIKGCLIPDSASRKFYGIEKGDKVKAIDVNFNFLQNIFRVLDNQMSVLRVH